MDNEKAKAILGDRKAWHKALDNGELDGVNIEGYRADPHDPSALQGYRFPPDITFSECRFPAKMSFRDCIFLGRVTFAGDQFKDKTDFSRAQFHGVAIFGALRGITFDHVHFFEEANFRGSQTSGAISFIRANFHKRVTFNNRNFHQRANFRNAVFHDFSDFTNAKFNGRANFSQAKFLQRPPHTPGCNLGDPGAFFGMQVHAQEFLRQSPKGQERIELAEDIADDLQLLRAKAEQTHTHSLVTDCHALWLYCQEVVRGWHPATWPSRIFHLISNYGRSVVRPFVVAAFTTAVFTFLYAWLRFGTSWEIPRISVWHYSLTRLIPIPGMSVEGIEERIASRLGVARLPELEGLVWSALSMLQGFIGLLTIFLVGLALRNRFKIG